MYINLSNQLLSCWKRNYPDAGIYFMVRHVDISSLLIRSKHCKNESGDCIYPGRLYVSYHEVYPGLGMR